MTQTTIPCRDCGQPMIEIDINRSYYLHQCDNPKCRLYKERQGYREKPINLGSITTFMPSPLPPTPAPPRGKIWKPPKSGRKKERERTKEK